jgi:hypothetical protein
MGWEGKLDHGSIEGLGGTGVGVAGFRPHGWPETGSTEGQEKAEGAILSTQGSGRGTNRKEAWPGSGRGFVGVGH